MSFFRRQGMFPRQNMFQGQGILGFLGLTGPAAQQRQMMRQQKKGQRIQQCTMKCQQKAQQCAQSCQGGFMSFFRGGRKTRCKKVGSRRRGGKRGGNGYKTQIADFYQAAPFSGNDTAQPQTLVNGSHVIQKAGKGTRRRRV